MAKEIFDLSKVHEWVGEFFFEEYDHRFFGKVMYSPEKGIKVSYTVPSTPNEVEKKRSGKMLYAVLDNGHLCTLFGNFDLAYSGFKGCEIISKNGTWAAQFFVIGRHLSASDYFDELCFDFENTQDFFFPTGFVDYIQYKKGALFEVSIPKGSVSIENSASFRTLPSGLRSILFCHNGAVIEKLQNELDKIREEYDNEFISFKNSLKFFFRLKKNEAETPDALLENIFNLSSLMALLLNSPIYPKEVDLIYREGAKNPVKLPVFVSIGLNERTLELANKEKHHMMLPLTTRNIDIERAIRKWFEIADNYSSVISSIQHETGYRTEHGIHSDLVLFSTQLEHINLNLKGKSVEKYTKPINDFGSKGLIGLIKEKLCVKGEECYGKKLSDLRNEIAHVGRPKKLLKKIGNHDQLVIAICMKLIVQSYILYMVGIEKNNIFEYQNKNLPA